MARTVPPSPWASVRRCHVWFQSTPAIFQLLHHLRAEGGDFKHPPFSSLLQQAHHFGHKVLATYELPMVSQPLIFGYRLRDRQKAILSVLALEK